VTAAVTGWPIVALIPAAVIIAAILATLAGRGPGSTP